MSTQPVTPRLVPLPDVPEGTSTGPVMLRAFDGGAALLEIDFDEPIRPVIVTEVIKATVDAPDADLAEALPPSSRISALLRLWHAEGGQDPEVVVACASCGMELELRLPLAELFASRNEPTVDSIVAHVNEAEVEVRLPTGADLANWATSGSGPVLADLGVPPRIQPSEIDRALSEADPLVDFALEAECPGCADGISAPLDLEQIALRGLKSAQGEVLLAIHLLAQAYSWSEETILALSPSRRRRYLEFVTEGVPA